jgi:hypothetical protein
VGFFSVQNCHTKYSVSFWLGKHSKMKCLTASSLQRGAQAPLHWSSTLIMEVLIVHVRLSLTLGYKSIKPSTAKLTLDNFTE